MPTAQSIDDLIAILGGIIDDARLRQSRDGYFPALYRLVTRAVKDGIASGRFQNGERMERLDVAFGNRYLEAYDAYPANLPVSESWGSAFDAAIAGLQQDFAAINDILNEQIDKVQNAIATVSPAMWVLDKVGGRNEERLVAFSLKTARELAWLNAQRLAANPSGGAISALDSATALLAEPIANPPGILINCAIWWVVRQENPSVPAIVDALATASPAQKSKARPRRYSPAGLVA
jgi:hypothetical protein